MRGKILTPTRKGNRIAVTFVWLPNVEFSDINEICAMTEHEAKSEFLSDILIRGEFLVEENKDACQELILYLKEKKYTVF